MFIWYNLFTEVNVTLEEDRDTPEINDDAKLAIKQQ